MFKIGDIIFTLRDNKVLSFKVECIKTTETEKYRRVILCGGKSHTNGTYEHMVVSYLCFGSKQELLDSL